MYFARRRLSSTVSRSLRTQARYDYSKEHSDHGARSTPFAPLATPRQLMSYLDEFCIGQSQAKKVLSVAVFNHYNRVRANLNFPHEEMHDWLETPADEGHSTVSVSPAHIQPHPFRSPMGAGAAWRPVKDMPMFEKSNVLVIGPTGSGKTLLAKTLARILDVPFSTSDATSFTQAGYVGEDVDACIQRLLQAANWDAQRAGTGIVYIDEVDKIARKGSGVGPDSTRDVGGEGVQQSLLRIMEGTMVPVQTKGAAADAVPRGPRTAPATPRQETVYIDTSNILFIVSGAFVGLDNIIKRRIAKGSIGFGAALAPAESEPSTGFSAFFTPNRKDSDPLRLVEPTDLIQFGFIPEFISRLPSVTTLAPLSATDLRKVLTEVRGSLISQYTALFGYSGVEIKFTSLALDAICARAAERGGGARGLRGILETLLLEPMYEVPGSNIRHVLITAANVAGQSPASYWSKGEAAAFWEAWAAEEAMAERIHLKDTVS